MAAPIIIIIRVLVSVLTPSLRLLSPLKISIDEITMPPMAEMAGTHEYMAL